MDGIVIAPLWDETQLKTLPGVLEKFQREGLPVLVAGNTARFPDVPMAVNNLVMSGTEPITALNEKMTTMRWDESKINNEIRRIASDAGEDYLDRGSLVCPDGKCDLTRQYGQVLIFDSGHWTLSGAELFGSRLRQSEAVHAFLQRISSAD